MTFNGWLLACLQVREQLVGGGQGVYAKLKRYNFLNVATLGNATDFGDLNNTNASWCRKSNKDAHGWW